MTTSPRWRVALASAASAAMLIASPLVGAQAAYAQPYPGSPPPLNVSTTTVTAGELLSFDTPPGIFEPGQSVTALLESTPIVLDHFQAEDDGSVAGTSRIPETAPSGWHVFRLTADNPDRSVGATIYVQGGVGGTPTPTPTPTKHPKPPGHPKPKPEHPGGHDGHGDGHNGSHGRGVVGDPVDYQHQTQHRNGESLAETGSEKALTVGGTAAALLVAGAGTMLAARRRRSS
ncbi:hypothetical protein SAMN02787118_120132 [Streptomyces mirabilis]|uniref:Gram-positive cocci surface proteins LPxTG domain-containing protein n=1 Tax=Streptomyces mirabilis TaxID=68239 RepID=A0A1I2RW26_9ACTN|nr:hypothetical protein SAMN02787118_120132 [Streptomyces mirabilis]